MPFTHTKELPKYGGRASFQFQVSEPSSAVPSPHPTPRPTRRGFVKQREEQKQKAMSKAGEAAKAAKATAVVKQETEEEEGKEKEKEKIGFDKLEHEGKEDVALSRLAASGGSPQKVQVAGVEVWFWSAEVMSAMPKGILFLAHGANHGAYDFFSPREVHGGVGLPEERAIVRAARRRGYACACISSINRRSKRWIGEVDGPRVARALSALAEAFTMPVHALGISDGGRFVFDLTLYVKVEAMCIQIMALDHDILGEFMNQKAFPGRVCFAHMPRDTDCASAVHADVGALRSDEVLSGRAVKVFDLRPLALNDAFFADRLPLMYHCTKAAGLDLGRDLIKALRARHFIDAEDQLTSDPRRSTWRGTVRPIVAKHGVVTDSLVADESPMAEILNVAYGLHECTSTEIDAVLSFLLDEEREEEDE